MPLPKNTERTLDPHVAQWVVRTVTRIVSVYAIVIGVAIIIGGPARFGGVSYSVALALPGAPTTWGVIVAVGGAVSLLGTILGRAAIVAAGLLLQGLWSLMFASAFAIAMFNFPNANSTGMWVYLSIALILFILGSAHLSMWRRK